MTEHQDRPVLTERELVKVLSALGGLAPLVEQELWRLDQETQAAVRKALSLTARTPSFDGQSIVYVRRFRLIPTTEVGD